MQKNKYGRNSILPAIAAMITFSPSGQGDEPKFHLELLADEAMWTQFHTPRCGRSHLLLPVRGR
ncbi:Hypothetical protein CINCED_3A022711 [Cinara cedri]|uniref:Uncharacterized protein n=1 Tax=Cinara cedri TaxID=506608 RepID=A0A5E4MXP6_9HEMI|nr:Hypothetical protein CINCED_3A022711 [Cinara cedri]